LLLIVMSWSAVVSRSALPLRKVIVIRAWIAARRYGAERDCSHDVSAINSFSKICSNFMSEN